MKTLLYNIRSTAKLIKIGFAANILEWYEFSIYNSLVLFMGKNFLAADHAIAVTIKAYAIFAIGYLARPLGSFFYGYLGSEISQGYALKRSLLTMAIPTALIGLLPTYSEVGAAAMLGLLVLRFIQGFAAGGELPMSACYVFEAAPSRIRSFLCSTIATGSSVGLLLSSATAALLFYCFDEETILNWAWRLPYLFSIPLSIWIFYLRNAIEDTVVPTEKASIDQVRHRFMRLLQGIQGKVLPLMLLVGFMETCVYMLIFWMPTYLHQFLGVPLTAMQSMHTLMLAIYIIFSLFAGYLAGRIGAERLLTMHISAILLFTYPLFWMLQGASYGVIIGVQIIFAWLLSGVVSVMMETLGKHFDPKVRAFGMTITHTLAAAFFGGTTPALCTHFTHNTELLMFPALYVMGFAVIALGLVWYLSKRVPDVSAIEINEAI